MGRGGFNKFIGVIVLLILLTLLKRWFNYSYALVWFGTLFGYYLPFIDHLFYAFVVRPNEEFSKSVRSMLTVKTIFSPQKIKALVAYVHQTKFQEARLIVHTVYFQLLFLLLTLLILTSNSNLFGRGLVYGFSLKLFVEQLVEFVQSGKIDRWFSQIPIKLDEHRERVYLYANGLVLFVFTLML